MINSLAIGRLQVPEPDLWMVVWDVSVSLYSDLS